MIQDSKLLSLFIYGINAVCTSPDSSVKFIKQDIPLIVKVTLTKGALIVSDGNHSIPCEFTREAIFWFRMEDPKKNIKELDGKFIALREYTPHSVLNLDGDIELFLHVHSFALVGEEDEAISKGKAKELIKDKEIGKYLELLKKVYLRKDMKNTDLEKLPDLEAILAGKAVDYKSVISLKGKGKGKKPKEEEKKKKGKDEEKNTVVKFSELDKVEQEVAEKVDLILNEEKELKLGSEAGSEMEDKHRIAIETGAAKIDDYFKDLLKKKGLLFKQRTPGKASPKRSPPKDIKKAVASLIEDENKKKSVVKEGTAKIAKASKKRAKAEAGSKKKEEPKATKKAAVEEGKGKKAVKAKKEGKKKA